MELKKQTRTLRCDVGGCKNYADYSLCHERGNARNQLNICESCMKEAYALMGSVLTPESIPSKFSKPKKVKAEK